MISKRTSEDKGRDKRALACVLAALMVFLIVIPAFAADEAGADDMQQIEDVPAAEEISEEGDEHEEGSYKENAQKEESEVPDSDEGGEEINAGGEPDKGSAVLQEEPAETANQSERAVLLKASAGERVSYTGKRVGSNAGQTTVFTVTSRGTAYTGACAEQGVAMKTSGHATITRIANTTKIAKVIYYYAIALGNNNWWSSDKKTDKVGKIIGMDHASDTDVTKRRMVEVFCQIYNMGSTDWYNTITSSSGGGWSTNTAKKVRDYYKNIDTSGITVPDGFEIWFAKSENSAQPFIMWAYKPSGYVTMKKISGNTSITG